MPRWPLVSLAAAFVAGALAHAGPLTFERHDFDSQNPGQVSEGMSVGDVDGDGRPDVIEGGEDALVWYHNPDWAPAGIATPGFRYSAGAMVVVRDMDGDGRMDVVTGRYPVGHDEARETLWFGNTGSGWVEHVLSPTAFCHDLAFGDLDADGDADAVCDDQFEAEIVLLFSGADPAAPWTPAVIDNRHPMGAAVADIDGDGRLDVLSGRAWYRNEADGAWTRYPFTTLAPSADPFFVDHSKLSVLDMDGDTRPDVFATLFADSRASEVYAFFAPPDPLRQPWRAVRVDGGPLWGVHSQGVGDFDGSGRIQVMVGEPYSAGFGFGNNPAPEVFVYRPLGSAGDPLAWERTLVDPVGTFEAQVTDVDGDGLSDIVGHEGNPLVQPDPRARGRISWWRSTSKPSAPPPGGPPPGGPPAGPPPAGPCTGDAASSVSCVCEQEQVPGCAGEEVQPAVERRLFRACTLLARVSNGEPGPGRLRRRAAAALRGAERLTARAASRGRLSVRCARAFANLHASVRSIPQSISPRSIPQSIPRLRPGVRLA